MSLLTPDVIEQHKHKHYMHQYIRTVYKKNTVKKSNIFLWYIDNGDETSVLNYVRNRGRSSICGTFVCPLKGSVRQIDVKYA